VCIGPRGRKSCFGAQTVGSNSSLVMHKQRKVSSSGLECEARICCNESPWLLEISTKASSVLLWGGGKEVSARDLWLTALEVSFCVGEQRRDHISKQCLDAVESLSTSISTCCSIETLRKSNRLLQKLLHLQLLLQEKSSQRNLESRKPFPGSCPVSVSKNTG